MATNWIDDRPEGIRLQNLAVTNMTGRVMSSWPKNLSAEVLQAIKKCEIFGFREGIDPSLEPTAIAMVFPLFFFFDIPSTSIFWPNDHFQYCMFFRASFLTIRDNNAHVILTADADSLPTDVKELLNDYDIVGCHSSKSNDASFHARINSSRYIRLLWESDDDDRKGHAAIFEIKSGKTLERAVKKSRERSVQQLFAKLESVASAVEGSDLDTDGASFEPTTRCINYTRKRQLMTRSGLLRCCGMSSPAHVDHDFACCCSRLFLNCVSRIVSIQVRCHFWRC